MVWGLGIQESKDVMEGRKNKREGLEASHKYTIIFIELESLLLSS